MACGDFLFFVDDPMNELFDTNLEFSDLNLDERILRGIEKMGFKHPTGIQAQLIPKILAGRDVFGQARTGTGKTAAFGVPILQAADETVPVQALILVPTRELAIQVAGELDEIGQFTKIKTLAIYGGQPIRKQLNALEREKPAIIVGTPGRVMDLHQRHLLSYENIKWAMLDEVDRMLDIGFRDDIRKIMRSIPGKPQAVFVSATLSPEIEKLAHEFMKEPEKIVAMSGSLTVAAVEQSYLTVEAWDKKRLLYHLLIHEKPELALVFCRMKITVDKVTAHLRRRKIEANAIHGDMPQSKRNSIMRRLRGGQMSVIIASDLAARGIDVSGITHVINFDLPEDPEIYIHRIGRTARAGRGGTAWSFVTPEDGKLLTQIETLANREIPLKEYPDFKPGPEPADVIERRKRDKKEREEAAQRVVTRYGGPEPVWKSKKPVDAEKFPGGIVPKGKPKRTLGGRARTRRGR